jgi:protoporphyrinogen oxidase
MPGSAATSSTFLVLGAGLAGLAAARALGPGAVVLEKDERPGGVVRSERLGAWHFDHAIHVLYFADEATKQRVLALDGHELADCPPEAWVATSAGTARFPLQLHLGGLDPAFVARCLDDLERTFAEPETGDVRNFEEFLRRSFGDELCELFFLPYNRKMWRRPLASLAPSGFQWNIVRPDLAQVKRGALERDARFAAYNAQGLYPRPPKGAPLRGIEVLPRALAKGLDVRLGTAVVALDPERREARTTKGTFRWDAACVATLPLPQLVALTQGLPEGLREACADLPRNRVLSVLLAVRGRRPEGTGHWRYYADESIAFNRLIWPHAFDPLMAPADGYGLHAEITEPAEDPPVPAHAIIERVVADARRVGALAGSDTIEDARVYTLDPAYVVFRPGDEATVAAARAALERLGVHAVGRYGRWEYSSMAQVMRDGFALGDTLRAGVRT